MGLRLFCKFMCFENRLTLFDILPEITVGGRKIYIYICIHLIQFSIESGWNESTSKSVGWVTLNRARVVFKIKR
jgi:hypothetical protein